MQEQLSQLFLFRIFVTETFAVPIDEVDFEVDDDVLVMTFNFEMYQSIDTESDYPNMEELEVN